MIQKLSILKPKDNSGIIKSKVFHVYKGFNGKLAFTGDFIKVSAREVTPTSSLKKKSKHKGIIIKSKFFNFKKDSSFVVFSKTNFITLKKRLTPKGKILKGGVSTNVFRKKFMNSFSGKI